MKKLNHKAIVKMLFILAFFMILICSQCTGQNIQGSQLRLSRALAPAHSKSAGFY